MNVSCPECRSIFRVDPSRIPGTSVRARCSVCGGIITIAAGADARSDFAAASVGAAVSAPARPSIASVTPHSSPAFSRPASPTPPGVTAAPTPSRPSVARPPVAPPVRPSVATPTPVAPRPIVPGAPVAPRPAAGPGAPAPFARPASAPGSAPPPFARPLAPASPAALAARPVSAPVAAPAAPRPSPAAAAPIAAPVAATPAATPAARPPINPFLANDPNAKAKRLARALVSDIVVYFPQKRDEGVRDGTLKQLFREEIKKSYEEYIDQIGESERARLLSSYDDQLAELRRYL